jgi:hypothetical protein
MRLKYYLRCFIITLVCSFIGHTNAQNLVPNEGFEQYSSCPNWLGQINYSLYWINPTTYGSPDYFNSCAAGTNAGVPNNIFLNGFQYPHNGDSYAGIFLWHKSDSIAREYLEIKLNAKLTAKKMYHLNIFINLANHAGYTTNTIGAYFSDSLISGFNNGGILPINPQINLTGSNLDTLIWNGFSGDYTAIGGEEYLIIGNFFPDSLTDTIFFQSTTTASAKTIYCYIDDVSLTEVTGIEENEVQNFTIFPNPTNLYLQVNSSKPISRIVIYNLAGEQINDFNQLAGLNKFIVDVSAQPSGLYNCLVYYDNTEFDMKKFSIIK